MATHPEGLGALKADAPHFLLQPAADTPPTPIIASPRRSCNRPGVRVLLPKGGRVTGKGEKKHLAMTLRIGKAAIPLQVFGHKSADTGKEGVAVGRLEIFETVGVKPRKVSARFTISAKSAQPTAELIIHPGRLPTRTAGWISSIFVGKGQLELVATNLAEEDKIAA
ncbi:MAG: hypothetical protein QOE22_634 [Candidatus Parcubacteria bacterium]|nr:hypothetical protein [Candidatus Parcubacteria bacterium]